MTDISAIQAILVIALLVGWAYTSMGKNGRSMKHRKNTRGGGSSNFKSANLSGKHNERSGSQDRKRNRSGGKFQK